MSVRASILEAIKQLGSNPHQHPPDKYRHDNDGSYRAFEIYRHRITYNVSAKQVSVIRIRHTRMNPLQ
ncbi:MAG: type II toxin-antitoxin system RelE/ParE family toxin [Pedobacter sp.]|nr:MAG: type II toxin-antitoxin system RelE/ParE family toxin [Pedobacter sp.]